MRGSVRLGGWTRLWIVAAVLWPFVVVAEAYYTWLQIYGIAAMAPGAFSDPDSSYYLMAREGFTGYLLSDGLGTLLLVWIVPPLVVYAFGWAVGRIVRWIRAGFRKS